MAWLIVIGRVLLIVSPIGVALVTGFTVGLTRHRTAWLIGAVFLIVDLMLVASVKSIELPGLVWWLVGTGLAAWFGYCFVGGFGLIQRKPPTPWENND